LVKVGNNDADSDADDKFKGKKEKPTELEMITDTDVLARFYEGEGPPENCTDLI